MTTVRKRSVLSGMRVKEAMRRLVIRLSSDQTLARGINHLIKFKAGALLVTDQKESPCGVVSKTDIMAAFYGGLPVETRLGEIMAAPPLFCYPDEEIEAGLQRMGEHRVHRLFVQGATSDAVIGTFSYPDIVGLLYRYCSTCKKGHRRASAEGSDENRARVKEAMTPFVISSAAAAPISEAIEVLSAHTFGAVLLTDIAGKPAGVISKTDLILAFHHGCRPERPAAEIMGSPVLSCNGEDLLADALREMLIRDVQRFFVHGDDPLEIKGVLSLSDAARFRSGTCKACIPSRFIGD